MNVEITLNDDNGQPVLMISNCHDGEFVNLKFIDEVMDNCIVSIEDLKLALRKIGIK